MKGWEREVPKRYRAMIFDIFERVIERSESDTESDGANSDQ